MQIRNTIALLTLLPAMALAQSAKDFIPAAEPNCAIETPPALAGLAATPGGFVLVYPRNDVLPQPYTGCKSMWIVNGERHFRLATLYFREDVLVTAAAHNVRDAAGRLDAACQFPDGTSLLPNAGRQIKNSGCTGIANEPFYRLRLPTRPRTCLTDQKADICQQDPS